MHNEIRGSRLLIIFSHLVEKQRSREEHIRKETYIFFSSLIFFSSFRDGLEKLFPKNVVWRLRKQSHPNSLFNGVAFFPSFSLSLSLSLTRSSTRTYCICITLSHEFRRFSSNFSTSPDTWACKLCTFHGFTAFTLSFSAHFSVRISSWCHRTLKEMNSKWETRESLCMFERETTMRFFFLLSSRRMRQGGWCASVGIAHISSHISNCTMSERENETLERERKRAKRIAFIHIEISLVKLLYKTLSISFCALTSTHTAYAHRTDTLHTREAPHKYFGWILWLCYFFSSFFHTPQPTRPCAVCATGRGEERKREMLEEKKLGRRRQKNKTVRESTEHRRQADFSMSIRVS